MPLTPPLVTVVTPAYKAEDFIAETMRSVWQQSYRPLQHVVVVDASPDDTATRAAEAAASLSGAGYEVRVIEHETNQGASGALNTAIAAASGDFISWLSADDLFVDPDKTTRQMAMLLADESLAGVYDTHMMRGPDTANAEAVRPQYTRLLRLSPSLRRNDPANTLVALQFANPINGTSMLLRRRLLPDSEWFDPLIGNYAQDGDLWVRMLALGLRLAPSAGTGTLYRQHPGQHSHHVQAQSRGVSIVLNRIMFAMNDAGQLAPTLHESQVTLALGVADRTYRRRPGHMDTMTKLVTHPSGWLERRSLDSMAKDLASYPDQAKDDWEDWRKVAQEYRSTPVFQEFEAALQRSATRGR